MPAKQPYIDDAHMAELRSLQALKLPLDVSRLVRLCDELNAVYRGECVMAVAMLCRAIKDHCPPVFGQTNFANVVSHTSAQSTRKILEQLESGLKNVADRHLHAHIRPREAIPAMTEVEFRPAMNVLIGEICVALRSKT
ncbi:MAG: hypothetical protein EON54_18595 [Alcaligenaceae bacterium]|nr:MAG: hypothetical protein EON54_18595 [Alcaligenaceae bacterium]